jgi:hypothetical protein
VPAAGAGAAAQTPAAVPFPAAAPQAAQTPSAAPLQFTGTLSLELQLLAAACS